MLQYIKQVDILCVLLALAAQGTGKVTLLL